jgi:vacuolar-type H+-ATPase subunit H
MGKNGAKDASFIELAGWEISKVKDGGLDEDQVVSLINDLISQRDQLAQRTEHFTSLTKLAERTVTEADKLAEEVKAEAVEQAKTETTRLMAEAEAKARQIEDDTKRIQVELQNSVQGLFSQLLSGLENLTQQIKALQAESEKRLTQPQDENRPATAKADKTPAAPQEPAPTVKQKDTKVETEAAPAAEKQETSDEPNPDLELEILPPLDIMKIMEIVTYLDSLPEIENTELIPNTERPSIIVSPRQPINLIDILSTMPEIDKLEEDSTEAADEGKPHKIQVSLSTKPTPQEAPKG